MKSKKTKVSIASKKSKKDQIKNMFFNKMIPVKKIALKVGLTESGVRWHINN